MEKLGEYLLVEKLREYLVEKLGEYLDNRGVMRYNTETAGVDCFYFSEK